MKSKKIKNIVEYLAFRCALAIFTLLPYRIAYWLMGKIAQFAGLVLKIRYNVAQEQLQSVFPEKSPWEIRKIIASMYRNLGYTAAETYLGGKKELSRVNTIGWENVENALDQKRGLILVAAHFGNWELGIHYLANKKIPVTVIAKKQRNSLFENYLMKNRQANGVNVFYTHNSYRYLLEALKQNHVLGLLSDQAAGREGLLMNFLGRPASVQYGPAKIAVRNNTPIMIAYALRNNDHSHTLVFQEAILEPKNLTISELTAIYSAGLEKLIVCYPHLWFWVHKRFKGAEKAKKFEDLL